MNCTRVMKLLSIAALAILAAGTQASAAILVFDDFNVNEGHFNLQPTFSGSTTGLSTSSTADRITTDTFEGDGSEQLVLLDDATPGGSSRLRFLSGSGSAAGNTPFSVAGAGTDGWIGLAVKTSVPGWTVQIWIEGAANNGSVPKNVIADDAWHVYQWNLDDDSGGPDGWGDVAGIIGGDADVEAGNYTIDSILFRHTSTPASSTILIDYVARDDAGRLVPEPATASLAALCLAGLAAVRRRR